MLTILRNLFFGHRVIKSGKKKGRQWTDEDRLRCAENRRLKQEMKQKLLEIQRRRLELLEKKLDVDDAKLEAQRQKYLDEVGGIVIEEPEDEDDNDIDKIAKEALKKMITPIQVKTNASGNDR